MFRVGTVAGFLCAGTSQMDVAESGLSCMHMGFAVSGMCGTSSLLRSLTILHRCSTFKFEIHLNLKHVVLENSTCVLAL